MFEDVIVGIGNLAGGRDAVALAGQLASPTGRLILAHVSVVVPGPAPDSASLRAAVHRRAALEQLTALREELGIDAELACPEARSVRQGLGRLASGLQADLLVVGASRSDEVARDLLGDHTRDVLENAPCAIAVAPLGYHRGHHELTKIGVAYDGSARSSRTLELAGALAAERGAELSEFEAARGPLRGRDQLNVEGELDPVDGLQAYGAGVDLLVLGPHDYTAVDQVAEQSTSQRLADDASTPLLVLAPAEPGRAHVRG